MPEIMGHISRAELSVKPAILVASAREILWIRYLSHLRVSQRHLLEMSRGLRGLVGGFWTLRVGMILPLSYSLDYGKGLVFCESDPCRQIDYQLKCNEQ
jgi:hypothetical protein